MWRFLTELSQSITLSFLPVGHTKFSPDWCFGLLKQKYRRTEVGCLNDIADVVQGSAEVNSVQLVGTQDGEVLVQSYDWTGFLALFFRRITNIKKVHHFRVRKDTPGIVALQEESDSSIQEYRLLRDVAVQPEVGLMPDVISPRGLPPERQWYLFEKIREYCPTECQDVTCPRPLVPHPSTPRPTPEPPSVGQTITIDSTPAITTRQRVCGNCGQAGHNRRTCSAQVREERKKRSIKFTVSSSIADNIYLSTDSRSLQASLTQY